MSRFLHLICDYAQGDMAWAEVISALMAKLGSDVRLHQTTVPSFDTVSTGFVLAQLALANESLRPENLIIFANTAPRKDRSAARVNNEGEGLLFGQLKNGVHIVVVNSGYSLSFVRESLSELWAADVEEDGSQFRSRDFFPKIVTRACAGDLTFKTHKLDPLQVIPEPPQESIAYIDSFGNLKTTFRAGHSSMSAFKSGDRIKVTINGIVRTATVATGSFNVLEGDLAFAPGSSGHDNRYWEFFQRGGSARDEFDEPAVGSKISIEKK